MNARTDVDEILALKALLRDLISAGVSYASIADLAGNHVNANAIKQFALRDSGAPRMTPLVSSLMKVSHQAIELIENEELKSNYLSRINEISSSNLSNNFLYNAFDRAQELASSIRFPKEYMYIRKFSKSDEIINIPISIFRIGGNYAFSMRIIGHRGLRYIYGNVLKSTHNITFDGFAFEVNELASKENLFEIDIFNESDRMKYLADNSHGQETLSFQAASLGNVVFPVGFGGLDRYGHPLIGTAILINPLGLDNLDTHALAGPHPNIASFLNTAGEDFPERIRQKISEAHINTYSVPQDITLES